MKLGDTVTVLTNKRGHKGLVSHIIEIDNDCDMKLKYRLAPAHADLWFKENEIS
jgi:hypothetical protein